MISLINIYLLDSKILRPNSKKLKHVIDYTNETSYTEKTTSSVK